MKTYLEKILEFEKKNPDYSIVKLADNFDNENIYYPIGEGDMFSGVIHDMSFGIAPKEGIYSISKLNEFMEYFGKQIGIGEKTKYLLNRNFSIEGKKGFFSEPRIFCMGYKLFEEHLNINLSVRETTTFYLEINDEYLLKNKKEDFKKLLNFNEVNSGKNKRTQFETIKLKKEDGVRRIAINYFPDELILRNSKRRIRPHNSSYNERDLLRLIGKENCNKIFDSLNKSK